MDCVAVETAVYVKGRRIPSDITP